MSRPTRKTCRAACLFAAAPLLALAESRPISLDQALKLTLEKSPEIQKARAAVAVQQGALREQQGSFDLLLRFSPSWEHRESQLSPNSRLNEERRRIQLEETEKAFRQLKEAYIKAIAEHTQGTPVCPGGFTTINTSQLVGNASGSGVPSTLCVPLGIGVAPQQQNSGNINQDNFQNAIQQGIQQADPYLSLASSFILPGQTGFGSSADFDQQINRLYNLGLESRTEDIRQRGFELLRQGRLLAEEAELRAALNLARLGVIPDNEFRKTASARVELVKPLRRGTVLHAQFSVTGVENNFRGRALDPTFGGKGIQNLFRSAAGLIINQPLGRGRGAVSAAAPERTARLDLEAAQSTYQHTVTAQALSTVLAYVDLIASQESLALLERSVESNREIVTATGELVKAGERAATELNRAEARLADAEASAISTRGEVLSARSQLAIATGLTVREAGSGLLASQAFAPESTAVEEDTIVRLARSYRNDLRAAEATARGSEILLNASRADLKRKLDLEVHIGAGSFYQAPFFRVLKDEQILNPLEPTDSPLDYFEPRGMWRGMRDRWTPNASVHLTFELPFGNRAAKGRLAKAQASLQQDSIRTLNLARLVDENVAQALGSLRRARAEVANRARAVSQYEATWRSSQALRAAGELTLIDLITTEQNLTTARLSLVQALRDQATALARLRFEAGTLVKFRQSESAGIETSGLVG